jgi:hypothetical protein
MLIHKLFPCFFGLPQPLLLFGLLFLLSLCLLQFPCLPFPLLLLPLLAMLDLQFLLDPFRLHQFLMDDQFVLILLLDLMFLCERRCTFLLILLVRAIMSEDSYSLLYWYCVGKNVLGCWTD